MEKTKEELNKPAEEVKELNNKLNELNEDELAQVSGGAQKKNWEDGDRILLFIGNGEQKPGEGHQGPGTAGCASGIILPQEATLIVVGDGEAKG